MKIKPVSNNCIELEQDNNTFEIIIVDGLIRVKELKCNSRDDKIIFKQSQKEELTKEE